MHNLPGVAWLDALVFDKVREATGGDLRVAMSGGAPLARSTQDFLSLTLCPLINGYGMTETSGCVTIPSSTGHLYSSTNTFRMGLLGDPLRYSLSSTSSNQGEPPTCIEIKLVSYPEAGYLATNNPPQGEVWIRGESVMKAYFGTEADQLNKEAFGEGGWFKTGDIGQWEEDGSLRIIDRKKNLVKGAGGEYIAIEKVSPSITPFLEVYNSNIFEC